jgi:hypothetical protein
MSVVGSKLVDRDCVRLTTLLHVPRYGGLFNPMIAGFKNCPINAGSKDPEFLNTHELNLYLKMNGGRYKRLVI